MQAFASMKFDSLGSIVCFQAPGLENRCFPAGIGSDEATKNSFAV